MVRALVPQGFGVLTWEYAGSLANRNTFFSIPLDGALLLFFSDCVCRGSGWPGGVEGGACIRSLYQEGGLPWSTWSEAPGVEVPMMMGWGFPLLPDGGTWVPVLPRGLSPLMWPEANTDDGAWWIWWSPSKGPVEGRGGTFPNDGTCSTGAALSAGQSSWAIARPER